MSQVPFSPYNRTLDSSLSEVQTIFPELFAQFYFISILLCVGHQPIQQNIFFRFGKWCQLLKVLLPLSAYLLIDLYLFAPLFFLVGNSMFTSF